MDSTIWGTWFPCCRWILPGFSRSSSIVWRTPYIGYGRWGGLVTDDSAKPARDSGARLVVSKRLICPLIPWPLCPSGRGLALPCSRRSMLARAEHLSNGFASFLGGCCVPIDVPRDGMSFMFISNNMISEQSRPSSTARRCSGGLSRDLHRVILACMRRHFSNIMSVRLERSWPSC